MRGTRLLGRLESQRGGESHHAGTDGDWVEGKTVFFSNQTQTTMLPQSFQSPTSIFAPVLSSPSSLCDVPNVVTLCPACYAWGLLSPAWSYTCHSSQTSLEVLSIVVLVKKSYILFSFKSSAINVSYVKIFFPMASQLKSSALCLGVTVHSN